MIEKRTGRGVTETYPLWERTTLGASPSAPTERSEGGGEASKLLYLRWELQPGAMREFFRQKPKKASAARAGLKEIFVRKFTGRKSQRPDKMRHCET